jgi:hypothetical protein
LHKEKRIHAAEERFGVYQPSFRVAGLFGPAWPIKKAVVKTTAFFCALEIVGWAGVFLPARRLGDEGGGHAGAVPALRGYLWRGPVIL